MTSPGLELEPTVVRLLEGRPQLRPAVEMLLERAATVRAARELALGGSELPRPAFGAGHARARHRLEESLRDLEALCADEAGADEATARARAVACAVAELKAESHRFAARRQASDPQARTELLRAIRAFRIAWDVLRRQAEALGVRRLPWQLEVASQVPPGTARRRLSITGYDLPGVPLAERSWGERCWLCGEAFLTDSTVEPRIRHRSLDACTSTLCTDCDRAADRLRASLERLGARGARAAELLAEGFPWLFDERIADPAHPEFLRLGLLDFPSLPVSLHNALLAYADRPFFGERRAAGGFPTLGVADRVATLRDRATSGYRWMSYDEVRRRSLAFAHALEESGLADGDRVALLLSRNRAEFYLADFACAFAQLVSVGLPASLAERPLADAVAQARPSAFVVDAESLPRILSPAVRGRCPELRTIFVLDAGEGAGHDHGDLRLLAGEPRLDPESVPAGWRSASGIGFDTPILYGDREGQERAAADGVAVDGRQRLYTVVFTSGSTGSPRGVPMTRRRWIEEMVAATNAWPYVVVSFQSSAYTADRAQVWIALQNGGRVGFARSGAGLFEDLRAVRPTSLDVPPVIWNSVYTGYKQEVARPDLTRSEAAAVRKRYRDSFGGRLSILGVGGAASDPGVRRTMSEIFGAPMREGYGTTETGYIARDGELRPGVEIRLIDRPELGFTSSDRPHPRGELAVRTPEMADHYLGEQGRDDGSFTADGFFLTGDLIERIGEHRIRILGRGKQVFKLAGAEYVNPEEVERHYRTSERIAEILITGSPEQGQVAAVIVPASDDVTEAELTRELRALARLHGLRACEIPAAIVVVPRERGAAGSSLPWTVDNGLLTSSLKLNRRALEQRYAEEVAAAYVRARADRESATTDPPPGAADDTLERLCRVVASLLGVASSEIDPRRSFLDHGGDSLGALELSLRLEQVFTGKGSSPPRWLDDPARLPLADLAQQLRPERKADAATSPAPPDRVDRDASASRSEATGADSGAAVSPVSDAGVETPTLLERLDADCTPLSLPDPLPAAAELPHLLLTGATGFLGVHLLALLATTLPSTTRIYTVVRAADRTAARRRLLDALDEAALADLIAPSTITADLEGPARVTVLAGDLEQPHFGLDVASWQQLARDTGRILHVAAKVSDLASYDELRSSNVEATRRVLELATERCTKSLHFVSSLSVASLLARAGGDGTESAPLGERLPSAVAAAASGYELSKWVAESMVQRTVAAARGSLCVSISRPAMITWSGASGFANARDWLTRIVDSCLELEAIPIPDELGTPRWVPDTPATARGIDMVPVDFVARAVARLAELPSGETRRAPVFHVSNRSPDELGLVSLQRLFDLLAAAWLRVTGRPLRALPRSELLLRAEIERAPVLPVLDRLARTLPHFPPTAASAFEDAVGELVRDCPGVTVDLVETRVRRWLAERTSHPAS